MKYEGKSSGKDFLALKKRRRKETSPASSYRHFESGYDAWNYSRHFFTMKEAGLKTKSVSHLAGTAER